MRRERERRDVALYEAIPNLPGMPPGMGGAAGQWPGGLPAGFGAPGEGSQQTLWAMIDDRMRGRWLYASLIGAALAAVLGFIGFKSTQPMFQSVGLVEIMPEMRPLLDQLPEHTPSGHYDRFVATQVEFLQGTDVRDEALRNKELAKLPFAKQPNAASAIKAGLDVDHKRDSQLIFVVFEHEDPVVAEAVNDAILEAYDRLYAQNSATQIQVITRQLEPHLKQLERDLNTIVKDRAAIEAKHTTTDLIAVQQLRLAQQAELEGYINDAKRQLNRVARTGEAGGVQRSVPPLRELMEVHPPLAEAFQLQGRARTDFEMLKRRFNPQTDMYAASERKAADAQALYDDEYNRAVDLWKEQGPLGRGPGGGMISTGDLEQMEKELAGLRAGQEELIADISSMTELRSREDHAKTQIGRVQDRIASLQLELPTVSNIIRIAQWGARPQEPYKDSRRNRAIMGIAFGLMASFGGFFLLGTIDRRAFGASQLQQSPNSRIPNCLGVLPDLGASLADPESSDVASHCVHQIRNQIEAVREPEEGYVLAISSPFQGDGKTSIVMALGWSYAAAGFRTLIIDCDLVGRSLTRQMGLVGREGLKEALLARELNGSVSSLPIENLSAVPVGVDPRVGPENVRRADLEKLLGQVRDRFDIILVDTGPMLGSLESTPVTAAADGVVLSVRRGRSRSRLEECVARIQTMGTTCVGVILNCAVRSDCNRYVSEASLAAAEEDRAARDPGGAQADTARAAVGERNALVRAMQSHVRSKQPEQ